MQGKIALEEHFAPPAAFDARLKYTSARLPNWPEFERRQEHMWDLGLAEMQANGVERMIASLGAPGIQSILDPGAAAEVAARANDFLKHRIDARPERFSGFAALPMQNPAAAAAELARCVNQLGFKGALVNGFSQLHSEDSALYYDHPMFEPIWDAAQSLDVPLYLHPRNPHDSQQRIFEGHPWLLGSTWAFGVETATHALRMMASGLFDRFPRLQVILGHLGEGLPAGVWRVDHRIRKNGQKTPAKRPLAEYFRSNFHITTSGNFHDASLAQALTEVGAERILFSADYPFEDIGEAAQWFDATPVLDEAQRARIGRDNALRLFRL